jgi:predicted ATPase
MIKKIKLCINHSCRIKSVKPSKEVDFSPGYNTIIGPNGSGKTTILEAVSKCALCRREMENSDRIRYISFEELNPKLGFGLNSPDGMKEYVRSLFKSHGQSVRSYLSNFNYDGENCLLIDSPETGQDLVEKNRLRGFFNRLVDNGLQLIVATNDLSFADGKVIELKRGYLEEMIDLTKKRLQDFSGK